MFPASKRRTRGKNRRSILRRVDSLVRDHGTSTTDQWRGFCTSKERQVHRCTIDFDSLAVSTYNTPADLCTIRNRGCWVTRSRCFQTETESETEMGQENGSFIGSIFRRGAFDSLFLLPRCKVVFFFACCTEWQRRKLIKEKRRREDLH